MTRHPLCAGPGCSSCVRIAADRKRRVDEVRDRLDAAGDVVELAALRWLAHEQPDLVNEALDAVGGE